MTIFSSGGESSMRSKSSLAPGLTPRVSESTAMRSETDPDGVVSETMREEEKKMKSVSAKEEEDRMRKTHAELQDDDGLNGAAVDERFLKLDRLLSQSKVGLLSRDSASFKQDCRLGRGDDRIWS